MHLMGRTPPLWPIHQSSINFTLKLNIDSTDVVALFSENPKNMWVYNQMTAIERETLKGIP